MPVGAANSDPAADGSSAVAADAAFGLYPAADFRLTDGNCTDCPTIPQALWYFRQETIAVPRAGLPVASFATGVSAVDDLRGWLDGRAPDSPPEYPPLVWVAAPGVVRGRAAVRGRDDARARGRHAAGGADAEDRAQSILFRWHVRRIFPRPDRQGTRPDHRWHDRDPHALAGGLPPRPRATAAAARPGSAAAARAARAHALRAGRRGDGAPSPRRRCGSAIRRATRCRRAARCWASW